MKDEEAIKWKFESLAEDLNERTRRLTAAAEAMTLGWGGISAVARATGVSQRAIRQGIKELKAEEVLDQGRIRRPGGGRKKTVSKDVSLWKDLERLVEKDVSLWKDLERLVEPLTRRGLISPLWWPSKSVRKLAAELEELGHQVSHQLVSELLHDMSFSLQVNRKLHKCGDDLDRYDQFSQHQSVGRSNLHS